MISRKPRRLATVPATLLVLALVPGISRAAITFSVKPVHTDTNLGKFQQIDPNTVQAYDLNNNQIDPNQPVLNIDTFDVKGGTAVPIGIQSPNGGGQAFLYTTTSANIGYIDLTPVNPPFGGFSVIEFNPFSDAGTSGQIYLVATDQFGMKYTSVTYTFDSKGENRINAEGLHGQVITRLEAYIVPPSADILKQFRVDAVLATAVPEPASFATAGVGLLMGLGYAWRRRKQAAA